MLGKRLSIQQVGEAVGKSPKTIRRLEAAGVLPKARRERNGYRIYTQEDVQRILNILYPPTEEAS